MGRQTWVIIALAAALCACDGSRDRTTGTRNGSGAPSGEVRDSGVGNPAVDAGTASLDGGGPARDGGANPLDSGEPFDSGGGPVQLDPTEDVGSLDAAELAELCRIVAAAQGTETAQCEGEITIEPTSFEECISTPPPSGCTVGEVVACMGSLQGDLCNFLRTVQCQALFECS